MRVGTFAFHATCNFVPSRGDIVLVSRGFLFDGRGGSDGECAGEGGAFDGGCTDFPRVRIDKGSGGPPRRAARPPSGTGPDEVGERGSRRGTRRGGFLALLLGFLLLIAAAAFWTVQPLVTVRRRATPRSRADPARLARDVDALVRSHSPRDFAHPENLRSASEYVAGNLRGSGAAVAFQEFVAADARYRNVIGQIGPDSAERIVVGAHYDTDGPFPGADDNASGVAGLLELGRLLAGEDLKTRVELVAYALEEMPFFGTDEMGSFVHARSLRSAGARVRAMVCLEMIGYYSDRPRSQSFPYALLRLFYPDRANFIAVVGRPRDGLLVRRVKSSMRSRDLPVHSINAPAFVPGVDLSDHSSYWRNGYPAVMITDTAFYRNPYYHSPGDHPGTLDYARMALVVEGVLRALLIAL